MSLFTRTDTLIQYTKASLDDKMTLRELIMELLSRQSELFASSGKLNLGQIPSNDNHTKVQALTDFALALREYLGDDDFEKIVWLAFDTEVRETTESRPFLRQGELSKAIFAVYANQSEENRRMLLDRIREQAVFKNEAQFVNFEEVILNAAMFEAREMAFASNLNKHLVDEEERHHFYDFLRYIKATRINEVNRKRKRTLSFQTSTSVLDSIERNMRILEGVVDNYSDVYYRQSNPTTDKGIFLQSVVDAINADIEQTLSQFMSNSQSSKAEDISEESSSYDYSFEHDEIMPEIRKIQTLIDKEMNNENYGQVELLIQQLHLLSDISLLMATDAAENDINAMISEYNHCNKGLFKNKTNSDVWKIKLSVSKTDDEKKMAAFDFLKDFFNDEQWEKMSRNHHLPQGIEQIRDLLNQKQPVTEDDFVNLANNLITIAKKKKGFKPTRDGKTKAVYSAIRGATRLSDMVDTITQDRRLSDMINHNADLGNHRAVTKDIPISSSSRM